VIVWFMVKNKSSLYAPVLVLLLVVASFYIGRLSAQVSALKGGGTTAGADKAAATPTPTGSKITVANLKTMAKGFGVDTNKFNKCLDDGTYAEKVKSEITEGQGLGVSGTPSFFINGILVVGSLPQTDFEAVIDAELKNGTGDKVTVTGETLKRVAKVPYGVGYIKGDKNAKVKIMEYTDFECPYCNMAFPTIEALLAKYGDKISLEYRSYPLPFHTDAQKAAEAALCAGDQGKFWEMHDKIFTVMAQK
jgi:protein-disulfide isomerase